MNIPTISIMKCRVPFIRTELALDGRERFYVSRPYCSRRHHYIRRQNVSSVTSMGLVFTIYDGYC